MAFMAVEFYHGAKVNAQEVYICVGALCVDWALHCQALCSQDPYKGWRYCYIVN